ncbi:MAG: MPMin1 gp20 [Microbacterium sp.]|nr:MPMin1 gp20 [Microbacterium sp.]
MRLGMPNAEFAEVIVVPDEPEKEWEYDDAARARVTAALAEIDANQAHLPTCALCGQRSLKLDRFGLCSKVSQPHLDWRAGVRADEKAGVAR